MAMERAGVAMCLLAEVGAIRQRGMYQNSWLDRVVRRFQDRWETSSAYRSAVSGAVGLLLILMLCSCLGVMSLAGNTVLAQFGLSSSTTSTQPDGSTHEKNISGAATFPIATFPPFQTPAVPPVSTIPTSQTPPPIGTDTPIPADTPTPTATVPCTSNCGGGGGTVTTSQSPTPWVRGQTGYLTFHTSAPNVGIALIYQIPGCVANTVEPAGQTDANGNTTISYLLQSCTQTGTGNIIIFAHFPGGTVSSGLSVACKS